MKKIVKRWIEFLPLKLRPRGMHYHPASIHQSATLLGKRIFILPTKQGLIFLLLLLVMLLGATNYSNNMAFALTFMFSSILFVSVLHTYRNLVGLKIRLSQVHNAFVGGESIFVIEVCNNTQRQRYDIEISSTISNNNDVINITVNDYNHASLIVPAVQRGLLTVGKITVTTRYPFGLFHAWSYVNIEGHSLIYPAPSKHNTSPPIINTTGDGMATSESGSDDFHGLRIYQPSDSMRHIDWKAYARERGLMTKQFKRHQSHELWLEWQATHGNNIEEQLSELCRWIIDAEQRQKRYGLRLPNIEIAPALGPEQQQRCLRQLAIFGIHQ